MLDMTFEERAFASMIGHYIVRELPDSLPSPEMEQLMKDIPIIFKEKEDACSLRATPKQKMEHIS